LLPVHFVERDLLWGSRLSISLTPGNESGDYYRRAERALLDFVFEYHPAFAGSYSLKVVLPALVPEMTYDDMAVANGQDAGLAWESLIRGNLDQTERDRIEPQRSPKTGH
jgi:hypothetical protein